MRFFSVAECVADDEAFFFLGFGDMVFFDCGFAPVSGAGGLALLCDVAGHTNAPARTKKKKNL